MRWKIDNLINCMETCFWKAAHDQQTNSKIQEHGWSKVHMACTSTCIQTAVHDTW